MTAITHIDEGLDFLGWRIQRRRKRGTSKHYVYTYPARKSVTSVTTKVKTLCRQNINLPLEVLLHRLNSLLRGWTTYFRPGVSSATFSYLRGHVAPGSQLGAPQTPPDELEGPARFLGGAGGPPQVRSSFSTPLVSLPGQADSFTMAGRCLNGYHAPRRGLVESRMRRRGARPVRRAARGNGPMETTAPRPEPTPTTSIMSCNTTNHEAPARIHEGIG